MKLQRNVSLADHTSLKAGGPAENLVILDENDSLTDVIKQADRPVRVLGFGTNVLVSDKGLPGTVILNQSGQIEVGDNGQIKATSGAVWDDVVRAAINSGLYGLEFTSGIPGGTGAAIAGSIAAYGQKVADTFVQATMLDSDSGEVTTWQKDQFDFGYRSSSLQQSDNSHMVVLGVVFQLQPDATGKLEYESALKAAKDIGVKPDTLDNRRRIILETRRRAGSLLSDMNQGPWTAGSFFKNPLVNETQVDAIIGHDETGISREKLLRQNVIHGGDKTRVSAAHVLLAAGFHRGQTWGPVRLHPDHILKIENTGTATASQIYDVIREILSTVKQKLDIELEPEVRIIGEF